MRGGPTAPGSRFTAGSVFSRRQDSARWRRTGIRRPAGWPARQSSSRAGMGRPGAGRNGAVSRAHDYPIVALASTTSGTSTVCYCDYCAKLPLADGRFPSSGFSNGIPRPRRAGRLDGVALRSDQPLRAAHRDSRARQSCRHPFSTTTKRLQDIGQTGILGARRPVDISADELLVQRLLRQSGRGTTSPRSRAIRLPPARAFTVKGDEHRPLDSPRGGDSRSRSGRHSHLRLSQLTDDDLKALARLGQNSPIRRCLRRQLRGQPIPTSRRRTRHVGVSCGLKKVWLAGVRFGNERSPSCP